MKRLAANWGTLVHETFKRLQMYVKFFLNKNSVNSLNPLSRIVSAFALSLLSHAMDFLTPTSGKQSPGAA